MSPANKAADPIAYDYLVKRDWSLIPIPIGSKAPVVRGWSDMSLGEEDLSRYFDGRPTNYGVRLGVFSGGLVDVDHDCSEALRLAPSFLPPTRSRFGRASKPSSHWLYVVTSPVETEKFADPDDGATLVEVRSTGAQTVFPGSVHPSGEAIEWDVDHEQARGDGATLRMAVAELASACLLARHWPDEGSRHDAALAAAGLFARGGLDAARAVKLVVQAASAAGDPDAKDRERSANSTIAKLAENEPVTGGPKLEEVLRGDGVKVVRKLRAWLGLRTMGGEPLTDVTNADRFVEKYGRLLRYCYAWKKWLHYDGRRWSESEGDVEVRLAKTVALSWFEEARLATDETRRKQIWAHARNSCSEPKIRFMLRLAQADLAITPAQLDADPWVLNCPNGTLELRTGELRSHRPEDFITKLTAAPYESGVRHAVWTKYLQGSIPDSSVRDFLQMYAGYSLTGLTREDTFVFCHGPGGGGKSTFLGALTKTWGEYAVATDFSIFMMKKFDRSGPNEAIARLAGARLVTSVESKSGARINEAAVKQLTGGDPITADFKYGHTFTFYPQFKLMLASNFQPRADSGDGAFWRRLRRAVFPVARLGDGDCDPAIRETVLDTEVTGAAILAWAVEGLAAYVKKGRLVTPQSVAGATAEYRHSQEPLTDFVADCCELGPAHRTATASLRATYETWCVREGIRPVRGEEWANALRALGCTQGRDRRIGRLWQGVGLRPEFEQKAMWKEKEY